MAIIWLIVIALVAAAGCGLAMEVIVMAHKALMRARIDRCGKQFDKSKWKGKIK